MIKSKISKILYRYQEQKSGFGVHLLRYYLIEGEIEELLRKELKECYKDAKETNGSFTDKEFEAWYNYKYKKEN